MQIIKSTHTQITHNRVWSIKFSSILILLFLAFVILAATICFFTSSLEILAAYISLFIKSCLVTV